LKNIEILERERLPENAARMGEHLAERLPELEMRHPTIGAVRGKGLLWAIEIVKDRDSRAPFPADVELAGRLTKKLRARGLLTRAGNLVNIAPPLVVNREEIDTIVDIIDDALTEFEAEL
jgi:4-aminobutyrate aminotransferase-like enzyme